MDERDRKAMNKGDGDNKEKVFVYAAMFNPMIHESVFGIISLHWNRKDAEMAMEFDKMEYQKEYGINSYTSWFIAEYEVK